MESLRDKVAIVGMGCTAYGDHYDKTGEDLLVEACYEAFEDAGVDQDDIQAAWLGGGITGQTLSHALKLNFVPTTRVENWCATGSDTLRNAALAVAGGFYDVALVAGFVTKGDALRQGNGIYGGGPSGQWFFGEETSFAGPPAGTFATFATRYAHHYELTYDKLKEGLGSIAVKNYANGMLNPKAALHRKVDMKAYLEAPMISWPLGLHDCCVMPSGAAAAVITRAELAPKFRDDYVLIRGLGMSVGTKQGRLDPEYDWVHFEENVIAGKTAYQMGGVTNPLKEIDLACVHDAFTVVELAAYEDLGFAPRGEGGDYAKAGVFNRDGELSVNSNGGLKSFGHGVGSSGIHKTYEVYKQLQGKCGERQVPRQPTLGLTHDQGGYPGTYTTIVTLLSTRD
ncbi:MAG: acetyl-CoA acetyltransferase [Dehalococcoidia bacterium]